MRLSQVARKLNVGTASLIDCLKKNGFEIENKPNSKVSIDQLKVLEDVFAESATYKKQADKCAIGKVYQKIKKNTSNSDKEKKYKTEIPKLEGLTNIGKLKIPIKDPVIKETKFKKTKTLKNNSKFKQSNISKIPIKPIPKLTKEKPIIKNIGVEVEDLKGLTVMGKMDLPVEKIMSSPKKFKSKQSTEKKGMKFLQVASSDKKVESNNLRPKPGTNSTNVKTVKNKKIYKKNLKRNIKIDDKDISEQIKSTLAKLNKTSNRGSNRTKYKKEKKQAFTDAKVAEEQLIKEKSKILELTEFISTKDLASLMNKPLQEVLTKCLELGIMVSINQRLDAETITIIADEFGFDIKFRTIEDEEEIEEEIDDPKDLIERPPIVTVMGHVDHGKTSLLDYIRNTKITSTEAGGITQHIGAYDVTTKSKKKIAFLDTPGHEAFTAMRSRGAQITDIAIIVIAADDDVMPQTKEAINHAKTAGVPIIVAINKIDKPEANSNKIKEELSKINLLVEDWGGKYQCQEISAKTGQGVDELLEKVLLEAELLELKANPKRRASGTVIEASLDKGRGYMTTVVVQNGTLKMGNIIIAGPYYGKVRAIYDYYGNKIENAPPSTPVQILGLNGAPKSGEPVRVMVSEKEARTISIKRQQILREQQIRTKKHITLDEISERLALGNFHELKLIIKADVDGSVEALSDSLLKLSTDNIKIVIIHKAVGGITDSDVLLASASDAIIIGFQVRPSGSSRKLAEKENIDIRLYSIIYDAINNIKDAIEGMIVKEKKEIIYGTAEVREVFKISKVGTIAGCYVTYGFIKRNNDIRLIRDSIVVYSGNIKHLKRYKNDIQEAKAGFECGLSIENFNDIKVGDIIESYGHE